MLYWALVFFVVALVAAVFGFGGVAAASAGRGGIALMKRQRQCARVLVSRRGAGFAVPMILFTSLALLDASAALAQPAESPAAAPAPAAEDTEPAAQKSEGERDGGAK